MGWSSIDCKCDCKHDSSVSFFFMLVGVGHISFRIPLACTILSIPFVGTHILNITSNNNLLYTLNLLGLMA
jgi:hypothetical protein